MYWPTRRGLPGTTGKERAMFLLEDDRLGPVCPVKLLSRADGRQFIRFSYAKIDSDIDDACRRLARLANRLLKSPPDDEVEIQAEVEIRLSEDKTLLISTSACFIGAPISLDPLSVRSPNGK